MRNIAVSCQTDIRTLEPIGIFGEAIDDVRSDEEFGCLIFILAEGQRAAKESATDQTSFPRATQLVTHRKFGFARPGFDAEIFLFLHRIGLAAGIFLFARTINATVEETSAGLVNPVGRRYLGKTCEEEMITVLAGFAFFGNDMRRAASDFAEETGFFYAVRKGRLGSQGECCENESPHGFASGTRSLCCQIKPIHGSTPLSS